MSVSNEKLHLVLPAGRVIMGDLATKQTKDHQNRDLEERKHHFFFGVAIPKTDPNVGAMIGQIQQFAFQAYANHANVTAQIQLGFAGNFAFKIDDGDDPKVKNEHAKGCFVFKFSTTLPLRACNNQNQQIDPSEIKRGFWVDVGVTIVANGATDNTAGIYLNPNVVRLLGYAEEIHSGPTPDQVFANAPAQLPPGASATPVAPSGGMPGATGGAMGGGMPGGNQNHANTGMQNGAQGAAAGGMPGAGTMGGSTASPTDDVTPHTGILTMGN